MTGEEARETVAVVVVHGIADQVRGATAEAVATQLALGTGQSVQRADVPIGVQCLDPAVAFERWKAPTWWESLRKSWRQSLRSDFLDPQLGAKPAPRPAAEGDAPPPAALRNSAAHRDAAGERSIDLGVRFTDYLLAKAQSHRDEAPPPAPFEMPRVRLESATRRVDVFEMYWADLSRLGGITRIATELFTLLFHLCELGAETLAVALTAAGPRKVFTALDRCHRWASWVFTRALALMFLQLVVGFLWLVPFAAMDGHGRDACMAMAGVAGLVAAGVVVYRAGAGWMLGFWVGLPVALGLAVLAHRRDEAACAWAAAVVWVMLLLWAYRRLLAYAEWRFRAVKGVGWVLMGLNLAMLAWGLTRAVPGMSPAQQLIVGALSGLELALLLQLITWVVLAVLITGAVLLGEYACGPHSTAELRQSVVTARLGLFGSLGSFVAVAMSVWALLSGTVESLLDRFPYRPWWFFHDQVVWVNARDFLHERFVNSTETFSIVAAVLLVLMGFIALMFLPSVLRELRWVGGLSSLRLGRWLTAGYRALDRLVRWWSCLIVPLLLGAMVYLVGSQFARRGMAWPCLSAAQLQFAPWLGAVLAGLLVLCVLLHQVPSRWLAGAPVWESMQRGVRQWAGVGLSLGLGVATLALGYQMSADLAPAACARDFVVTWGGGSDAGLTLVVNGIAGGAVSLVALGRVAIKQLQALRAPLDAALDVDNHFREYPRAAIPRVRIFERYVAVLQHVVQQGYQRVVIVAHSQGTVITADLLRYLQRRHLLRPDGLPAADVLQLLADQLAGHKLRLLTCGSPLRQLYALRFPTRYDWVLGGAASGGTSPGTHSMGAHSPDTHSPGPHSQGPAPPAGWAPHSGPQPWRDLGVSRWVNVWGSGDYVGRWLWSTERDEALPTLAVSPSAYEPGLAVQNDPGSHASFRDLCLGADAHTHYFEVDQQAMVAELQRLL